MTEEQELHMKGLAMTFAHLMARKYRRGAKEHGGNIWDMSREKLLDNALDEAIDQVVYLLTLKQKLLNERVEKAKMTIKEPFVIYEDKS